MSLTIQAAIDLYATQTSEGAKKAWDTRGRGKKKKETKQQLSARAARAKKSRVSLSKEKEAISFATEAAFAKAIGGVHLGDNSPFDVSHPGKKMLFEIKNVFEEAKHARISVKGPDKHDPVGSRQRKIDYAKKFGTKNIFAVAVSEKKGSEGIYIRRFIDPKDKRPGWSFKIENMTKVKSFKEAFAFAQTGKSLEV